VRPRSGPSHHEGARRRPGGRVRGGRLNGERAHGAGAGISIRIRRQRPVRPAGERGAARDRGVDECDLQPTETLRRRPTDGLEQLRVVRQCGEF
jgi:hypothetical protein